MNLRLLALIESIFGKHEFTSNNNYYFYSPFISHRKPKLAIKMIPDKDGNYKWNCWVSKNGGYSIHSLFIKSNVDHSKFLELNAILGDTKYIKFNQEKNNNDIDIKLPNDFIQLEIDNIDHYSKKVVNYLLNKRNISWDDIYRYKIGISKSTKYNNYVIIPSYSKSYKLNYYYGRSILNTISKKHILPDISKDLIVFENLLSKNNPIVICEGVFDAISIKTNAIPLMGKMINDYLMDYIHDNNISDIIMCLDPDAIKSTIGYLNYFLSIGKNVFMCDLMDKDPSEHGDDIKSIVENAFKVDISYILKMKVVNGRKINSYI